MSQCLKTPITLSVKWIIYSDTLNTLICIMHTGVHIHIAVGRVKYVKTNLQNSDSITLTVFYCSHSVLRVDSNFPFGFIH